MLARRIHRMPWTSSFPSGHAASAAAFAAGATMELPMAGPILVPLAAAVAYSRVHVGVHYRSDVWAGAAIGLTCAVIGRVLWPVKPWGPALMAPGNAPALACELVAAARTADAVEDSFVHQCLQHGLEMARREIVPRRELARRHRPFARIERDINDRSDGEQTLVGEKRHGGTGVGTMILDRNTSATASLTTSRSG